MGKKAQKPSKAAAKSASHAAADSKKQKGQAGSKKLKRDVGYDSLRDPLDRELALVGLRVKQITADGNCFFRALSDQLEGNEGQHSVLRAGVVAFMKEHEEDFAPFVEDDQTFEAYTARMRKEGTWAGHMELQAASCLLQVNIVVYQAGQPRWAITNFPQGTRKLHLSYHDGEHYNSVRRADDYNPGPPEPIEELAAVGSAAQLQSSWSAADEAAVAAGTGCDNPLLIKQQLEASKGDVDAAIEAIIEILAAEDSASIPAGAAAQAAGVGESSTGAEPRTYDQQQCDTDLRGAAVQQIDAAAPPEDQPAAVALVAVLDTVDISSTALSNSSTALSNSSTALSNSSTALSNSSTAQSAAGAGSSVSATDQQRSQQQADDANASATSATPSVAIKLSPQKATSEKPPKGGRLKGASKLKHSAKGQADADDSKRPSRNKPCPCGSGRKHKNCCGMKGSTGSSTISRAAAGADGLPVMLDTLHI